QTGHVWGSIGSLFTPGLLWLIADWPLALWLAARMSRVPPADPAPARVWTGAAFAAAALAASAAIISVPSVLRSTPLDQMFRARTVVEQLGPFGYHAYDAWTYVRSTWLRPPATAAQVDEALAWLRDRAPLRAPGAAFGAARGRNLIVVQ